MNTLYLWQKRISHRLTFTCPVVILALFLTLILNGCTRNATPISKTGLFFDTVITITVYDDTKESCLEECFALAKKYENLFSPTIEGSDVWNINHSNGEPVEVSEETAYLIKTALSYCELTDGQIDLTVNGISELWDFHEPTDTSSATASITDNSRIPDSDAITAAVNHVDYHNLIVENNTVTLTDKEASISLGFIAKGY